MDCKNFPQQSPASHDSNVKTQKRRNKEISIQVVVFGSSIRVETGRFRMFLTKISILLSKVTSGSTLGLDICSLRTRIHTWCTDVEELTYSRGGYEWGHQVLKQQFLLVSQCSWKCSTTVHLPGPVGTVCTDKRLKLPGFDQPVHFGNGRWALGYKSGLLCGIMLLCCISFLYKYYFCFVNGPNIWNLNMFLVHLHKQMQCGIHLELGKCTITVHIFLHTTAHFSKIINTSAIKNEQILVLEVFTNTLFFIFCMADIYIYFSFELISTFDCTPPRVSLSQLISTLQCFPHLACLDFPSDPFSPISSVWPK